MPRSEAASLNLNLRCFWKIEQAHGVCNMTAALADGISQLLLRVAILIDKLAVGFGFFKWVEIGALHIFDECNF